jgi:4-amino-4-deoxy-L-arabinose transferase-like glycosyltransferase
VILLGIGAVLRLLATIGYRPALIYIDSTVAYLDPMPTLDPRGPDPLGYDLFLLRPVLVMGNLLTVAVVQHLLGLAMGVALYALLVRKGCRRWLAALAAAPVLVDAYQVQIEQNILSDTLFQVLLVAALCLLAWRNEPGWRVAAATGLLLGMATLTRVVGAPVIIAALAYLLVTAHRSRRFVVTAAAAVAFAAPLLGYATYYHHVAGQFAITTAGGNSMYGRVASFVNCDRVPMPSYERELCPTEPLGSRHSPDYYAHDARSPQFHFQAPPGMTNAQVIGDFTRRALVHEPGAVTLAVAGDAVKLFSWTHTTSANPDAPTLRWQFQTYYPMWEPTITADVVSALGDRYGGGGAVVVTPLATVLRGYQMSVGYTPGPVHALAILAGLVVLVLGWRRTRRALRAHPARRTSLLFLAAGVLVLLAADTYEFTWRYQLPALVLLPPAGALAVTALTRRSGTATPGFPEPADHDALAAFAARYGDVRFPPVVVVIAAYNEAEGLGPVLDSIPPSCLGEEIATLVVVDGGSDDTARVAMKHGVYTCVAPINRGQGAALRLGYHIARTGGAEYIVTTDADGQYDMAELPRLLEPLLTGGADFVTGSRRLGADSSPDRVRRTGVRVFAWLVSTLTGHPVTDTSFGFRAMAAWVTAQVTLKQPQYQASELLIEVIGAGFRVAERPMTMRPRSRGKTKKGNNLLYGYRYTRVVLTTWIRQGVRRPVPLARSAVAGAEHQAVQE